MLVNIHRLDMRHIFTNFFKSRINRFTKTHQVRPRVHLQYVSDLHVDVNHQLPEIVARCDNLAICGDLGKPDHPNFQKFLKQTSQSFKNVYFVAGNHDFDCGPQYEKIKVDHYKPMIKDICSTFKNVHLLDRSTQLIDDGIVIAGTTLWSRPIAQTKDPLIYKEHLEEHEKDVQWIEDLVKNNQHDHNIIMLTHFVPTFQLIAPQYQKKGLKTTSWFATDLEHLIEKPITAWLCGHSHSIITADINAIYCGINAYGYHPEIIADAKLIEI